MNSIFYSVITLLLLTGGVLLLMREFNKPRNAEELASATQSIPLTKEEGRTIFPR